MPTKTGLANLRSAAPPLPAGPLVRQDLMTLAVVQEPVCTPFFNSTSSKLPNYLSAHALGRADLLSSVAIPNCSEAPSTVRDPNASTYEHHEPLMHHRSRCFGPFFPWGHYIIPPESKTLFRRYVFRVDGVCYGCFSTPSTQRLLVGKETGVRCSLYSMHKRPFLLNPLGTR